MKLLHYFKFKLVNHAHSNFFFWGGGGLVRMTLGVVHHCYSLPWSSLHPN